MKLINIVIEASRVFEHPRLNKRAAEQVIRAVAEWVEEQGTVQPRGYERPAVLSMEALAQRMRDEILIGRTPK